MLLSLDQATIEGFLEAQLGARWPGGASLNLKAVCKIAIDRMEAALSHIILPGYVKNGQPYFNIMHGDQSAMFYYFLANSAYRYVEDSGLAEKFFLLNKSFNGIVCMYDTELPEVFLLIHTVGSVLGKATYGNFFVAYQTVTIGTDKGISPTLGAYNVVFGGSVVLGSATFGDRVIVSANSTVIGKDVPSDCVVIPSADGIRIKPRKRDFALDYFRGSNNAV